MYFARIGKIGSIKNENVKINNNDDDEGQHITSNQNSSHKIQLRFRKNLEWDDRTRINQPTINNIFTLNIILKTFWKVFSFTWSIRGKKIVNQNIIISVPPIANNSPWEKNILMCYIGQKFRLIRIFHASVMKTNRLL